MAVRSLKFACIYVGEAAPNLEFYETYLGFKLEREFRPGEYWGMLGEVGCWIGTGYKRADTNNRSTRATVMFGVESTGELYQKLKAGGQTIVQEPMEMDVGIYWMQFADPSGNILDVLGTK